MSCTDEKVTNTAEIGIYLSNGQEFLEKRQFHSAIIEARNAIQLAPDRVEGHMLLASIFNSLGQGKHALIQLESVPGGNNPEYYLVKSRAFLISRKFRSCLNLLGAHRSILETGSIEYLDLRASALAGLGELETSKAIFISILKIDPHQIEAKLGLAAIESSRENLDKAEQYIDDILSKSPENPEALVWKGNLAFNKGELADAETYLTKASSSLPPADILTPQLYNILKSLQKVLLTEGRTGEALVYAKMITEAFPELQEAEARLQSANQAFKNGNLIAAEKLLREILLTSPGNETVGTLLGVINYLKGKNDLAEEFFNKNLDLETATPVATHIYALTKLRLNQPKTVLSMLADQIETTDNLNLIVLYGVAAINAGQIHLGESTLRRALEIEPENARVRLLLAQHYNNKTNPDSDKALKELRLALASQPSDPYVQSALLQQFLYRGNLPAARDLVRKLLRENPDGAATHQIVASFYSSTGNAEKSLALYEKSIQLSPKRIEGYYGRAQQALALKNWSLAEESYQEIIEMRADEVNAYKGIITLYEMQNKITEGLQHLVDMAASSKSEIPYAVLCEYHTRHNQLHAAVKYLQLTQDTAPESLYLDKLAANVFYLKALDASSKGDSISARTELFAALESNPGSIRFLSALVEVEIKAGQASEADKIIDEIRLIDPDNPIAHLLKGDLAASQKDFNVAIRNYRNAWNQNPNDQTAVRIFSAMRASKEQEKADAFLTEWQKVIPDSARARITAAGRFMEAGRNNEAIGLYEAILKDNPDSAMALNNLAWLYQDKDFPKALVSAKKAFELASSSTDVIDTYGWLLYKSGDKEQAAELLQKAVELAPGNQAIRNHLDEVLSNP